MDLQCAYLISGKVGKKMEILQNTLCNVSLDVQCMYEKVKMYSRGFCIVQFLATGIQCSLVPCILFSTLLE